MVILSNTLYITYLSREREDGYLSGIQRFMSVLLKGT